MALFLGSFFALILPFLMQQGIIQDQVLAGYQEALAQARTDGIPALIRRLDAAARLSPSSPFTARVQETILVTGLLHPGSVADQTARLAAVKSQGSTNPTMADVAKRIEILQAYYKAAAGGTPETASAALSDPVFAGSLWATQALADAALRERNYDRADVLAQKVIEADPFSPLLANAQMILGLSATFRGDSRTALRHFQKAFEASELPTIYGNTRDRLLAGYRFARPVPAEVGGVFDEIAASHLAVTGGLKDPQSLLLNRGQFVLVDKEQIFTVSTEGKILDAKPARKLQDIAATAEGRIISITEDRLDPGTGTPMPLSISVAGRQRALGKMRSLAIDTRGSLYLLDQDLGLFRCSTTAAPLTPSLLSPIRGRLVRIDSRDNIFLLAPDGKSISILSREGKQVAVVSPATGTGKEPSIEYFALDSLNHLYVLDAGSIHVFAINDGSGGIEAKQIGTIILDQRPQFKNLRVLGVTATGELLATGKNEDNWLCFR